MRILVFNIFILLSLCGISQTGVISGQISADGVGLPFATVQVKGSSFGSVTDSAGYFEINVVPLGQANLSVSYLGYKKNDLSLNVQSDPTSNRLNIVLEPIDSKLNSVVVTGTRTSKKIDQSPVMVNLIDSKTLEGVQVCNLSDGLKFQPGLRVETDCQTCNYTQLRMNGLAGGYSQILINGRPIFSPLTGLYGMEQIPVNMIERVEIVRGGGSALYGSSAVGGTVNVITKIPVKSGFDLGYTYQNISGSSDHIISGNATVVSKNKKTGSTFFLYNRLRDYYDHNDDGFSELPKIENRSVGTNFYFKPKENQKLELNFGLINEYRIGGEMSDQSVHFLQQAEERSHEVLIGNVDYQINFNNDNSSFIPFLAIQRTDRNHYTGIFPDDSLEILSHMDNPPYGVSKNITYQTGLQLNHRLRNFLGGINTLTVGAEYLEDDVVDDIDSYNYHIDQNTRNLGSYIQSDWQLNEKWTLLTGLRLDKHNFVDNLILSPRISGMYKPHTNMQFRLTWGTGFRAPQAFDTDLHIAFAGGGVSRVSLAPDLKEERSKGYSASMNYDKVNTHYIIGFTLEGFYTVLDDAFYLQPTGTDQYGETFEKRNGSGATVQGLTIEVRANLDGHYQLESGFTFQSSLYSEQVDNIQGLEAKREFLRTPNEYGYSILTINPGKKWSAVFNMVYTGPMLLAHFGAAPEQSIYTYKTSVSFTELSFKTSYTFPIRKNKWGIESFAGIKNFTNAYQDDFDIGKNRDSNYIYGPSMPRSFFLGIKIRSI